ncbi:DUF4224 domain-containing protein [Duganella sp. BJB1802]|uniref:DUF4224 domain-containing protein n=1 Tax=Duganella sp. BJB1802 TaxID=2744575 RepID=UPI00159352EA|nr:DUF4224 domain-containing protein [Duganella sp. BJB1802]NVD74519.1 DUF4224 domain-containing protein [Duganella sp. BJB1802]
MSDMFLTKDEIATLTGRKSKSKQIEALRTMGLPFWVNALDAPVVPRSAIEGRRDLPEPKPEKLPWIPAVLR